ncbi:LapA family protein [Suttonella sp. R2A3]|uniref:LapA family protein n=1 Tax=Suttonella sp. R2A3 TaxID=2908648 RepID=UPI001F2B8E71|nr:LapA family protein [Suttonella sp. R2A3]UJF25006.1 LapA family protein [Suttonella sp. R2A3]
MIQKWFNYAFIALFGVVFILMGLLNSDMVTFNYLLGEGQWPLVLVMAMSFVIGALFSLAVFGLRAMVWRSRAKKLQKQIDYEHEAQRKANIRSDFHSEQAA